MNDIEKMGVVLILIDELMETSGPSFEIGGFLINFIRWKYNVVSK